MLNLESGERENQFQFKDEFSAKVEKHLAHNQNWIVIPFEKQTLILDIQTSQIKFLEKAKGKKKLAWSQSNNVTIQTYSKTVKIEW